MVKPSYNMDKNRMFGFKHLSKTSPERRKLIQVFTNTNGLDYMTTIFQNHHFGMDGEVAELANSATVLRIGHGSGCLLPGKHDELAY